MRFSRFGKKILPDPSAPRTGFLPRMAGPAEIGNKSQLRAVDAFLQMEGTAGTPSILEATHVVPVIDIGRVTGYTILQGEESRTVVGVPVASNTIIFPGDNGADPLPAIQNVDLESRILALNTKITLGANSALNDQFVVRWRMVTNLGGTRVPMGGCFARQPIGTLINETEFDLFPGAMGGPLGLSSSANIGPLINLWVPANFDFDVSVIYQDATGTAKNFPLGSSIVTNVIVAQTPRGIVPPL